MKPLTPLMKPENAAGRVSAMMLSGTLTAASVLFLRWPAIDTSIIMSSLLNVFMNYDIEPFSLRAERVFKATLLGGLFQITLTMLAPNPFLLLYFLFVGLFLILYMLRKESSEAVLTAIVGILSMQDTGGFLNAENRFIFLQYTGLWALTEIQVVRWIIPYRPDSGASVPKQTINGLRAFTTSVQITFGIWLWKATQMPQGVWIALTPLLIHVGGIYGDRAAQRASARMLAAPAGFIFGFLYLGLFCWFDYRMAYAFPVFLFLGFYLFFRTGHYFWNMFFQMLFFVLLYDILNGEYHQFDVLNVLVCRTAAIMTGAFLAIYSDPERDTPAADLMKPF